MTKYKYSKEFITEIYEVIIKEDISVSEAARRFKMDRDQLIKRLKFDANYYPRRDGKKRVDSNYFKNIDCEEKAYWLGFLSADGYVNQQSRTIELCLAAIDKHHVEKFKLAMKSGHKISKKTTKIDDKTFESFRISIKDGVLTQHLAMLGLTNKKSFDFRMPENIDDALMRHFIRGFFDGDGCIYKSSNNYHAISISVNSFDLAKDIVGVVEKFTGVKLSINKDKRRETLYTILTGSKQHSRTFLEWMYLDSNHYLERKHNKFTEYIY